MNIPCVVFEYTTHSNTYSKTDIKLINIFVYTRCNCITLNSNILYINNNMIGGDKDVVHIG